MRLEQLQYLVDVADTHSITSTAQNFFVSQQAASNSLKSLENEMDAIFLERSPSGVELTAQGQEMAAFARRVLADLAKTRQQLALMQQSPSAIAQTVRICVNSVLNTLVMPKVLARLQRQEKTVTVSIAELNFDKMPNAILDGQYDLALLSIDRASLDTALSQYPPQILTHELLFQDKSIACMHYQSPYAKQDVLDNDDLLQHIPHTIYSIAPMNDYEANQYFGALICSSDVSFHKKLLMQKQTVTQMAEVTYRHLFKDSYLIARPISYTNQMDMSIAHSLLYKPPLTPACAEVLALIKEYTRAI